MHLCRDGPVAHRSPPSLFPSSSFIRPPANRVDTTRHGKFRRDRGEPVSPLTVPQRVST